MTQVAAGHLAVAIEVGEGAAAGGRSVAAGARRLEVVPVDPAVTVEVGPAQSCFDLVLGGRLGGLEQDRTRDRAAVGEPSDDLLRRRVLEGQIDEAVAVEVADALRVEARRVRQRERAGHFALFDVPHFELTRSRVMGEELGGAVAVEVAGTDHRPAGTEFGQRRGVDVAIRELPQREQLLRVV